MIQRIQSVYLFLTTIFSVLFLSGDILRFLDNAGNSLFIGIGGLKKISGPGAIESLDKLLPLTLLLVLIPVISFTAIFLFKNRKLQMKFTFGLIILVIMLVGALAFYAARVVSNFSCKIVPGILLILPVFMVAASILAYRAIRKDEKIVKSYDRMR